MFSKYRKVVTKKVAGPDSYTTGGFEVTVGEVEVVEGATVSCDNNGYIAEIAGISGNKVTVRVRKAVNITGTVTATHAACAATSAAYATATNLLSDSGSLVTEVAPEVDAGTDLSGVTFYIVAQGV